MNTKLYVGNLSYSTTEDTLRTLFSQAGTVASVELIKDRDTGASKGFAFVEMGNQSESEGAIKTLNGYLLDNRSIKVNVAKPREERPQRGWYEDSSSRGFKNQKPGTQKRRSTSHH
jgi:RNA recognition motif-containing protein